jgi:FkbM family methyltransferase
MKILAHLPFIGTTGYANHARSFFCALNKHHTVKVRNFTVGSSWVGMNDTPHNNESYITKEMKDMLILQTLWNSDGSRSDFNMYGYKGGYVPDVHIVLMEQNHHFYYDNYDGYKIAYCVWESTLFTDHFFKQLLKYDEMWVPTQWQYDCIIEQGYPAEKVFIVPEGVDVDTFKPLNKIPKKDKFRFLHFGRWDYRKGTTEILKTFSETFSGRTDVELIASVENPYPYDGLKSTEERLEFHNISTENIELIKFTPREDYIKYLQEGDVFISCARSEGWNLPLIEAMACGTPSIYSNWGGQLQFAEDKGLPVKISHLRPANIEHKDFPGEYCEPDWKDLGKVMLDAVENYENSKLKALEEAKDIHENFNWEKIARDASKRLDTIDKPFVFVTTGNLEYMPVIEKLVQSVLEFSKCDIIVYGVDCEVPFDYPNVIKRTITPPKISEKDKWYWKQWACLESVKEGYDNFIWIDGDVVVNYNIDKITKQLHNIENYPISDVHVQTEFFGWYDNGTKSQYFNRELCKEWGVNICSPYMHICFYIYNKKCGWWFEELLGHYVDVMKNKPEEYGRLYLWNDEGIDNAMRCKYGFTKHLPLSNFDTSSYDGDDGMTNETQHHFLKFWNEDGPQNFNRIFGYQAIPKDKSDIIYFHGNKSREMSDFMINYIKMKRDDSFYKSEYFYTSLDTKTYKLENLGDIKDVQGGTMDIANKYGWARAIYHEIFNLDDYYKGPNQDKINKGDVVVDLGGNIGIFNRWAYHQGASKVISFEPDRRYFNLLRLNADPRSILFNAAVAHEVGELNLYESEHLGGSNVFRIENKEGYNVRTYTLNYLFESGLVDKIDFLKVDIEGAEHAAFAGISDENLKKVKTIAMEYHNAHFNFDDSLRTNFVRKMNDLGFSSYTLYMGHNNALQMIYFNR